MHHLYTVILFLCDAKTFPVIERTRLDPVQSEAVVRTESRERGGDIQGEVFDFHFPRIAGEDVGLKNPKKSLSGIGVDPGDTPYRPIAAVVMHGDVGLLCAFHPDHGAQRTALFNSHDAGVAGQRGAAQAPRSI